MKTPFSILTFLLAASTTNGLERRDGLFSRCLQGKGDSGVCGKTLDASLLICTPFAIGVSKIPNASCYSCSASLTEKCGPQWKHSCDLGDLGFSFSLDWDNTEADVSVKGKLGLPLPNQDPPINVDVGFSAALEMAVQGLNILGASFSTCSASLDLPTSVPGIPDELLATLLEPFRTCSCTASGAILDPTVTLKCGSIVLSFPPPN